MILEDFSVFMKCASSATTLVTVVSNIIIEKKNDKLLIIYYDDQSLCQTRAYTAFETILISRQKSHFYIIILHAVLRRLLTLYKEYFLKTVCFFV